MAFVGWLNSRSYVFGVVDSTALHAVLEAHVLPTTPETHAGDVENSRT
jgi:hypothetical protein